MQLQARRRKVKELQQLRADIERLAQKTSEGLAEWWLHEMAVQYFVIAIDDFHAVMHTQQANPSISSEALTKALEYESWTQ